MSENDPIPLELIQKLKERDILILLVQAVNTQSKSVETISTRFKDYIDIIEKKVGRDEFKEYKTKADGIFGEHDNRLKAVEGNQQDNDVKKKFFFGMTSNLWAVIVAGITLMNFFLMLVAIGSSGQS